MGPFRGPYRGSPLRDPCWWAVTTEVAAHWEEVLMGPFRGGTHTWSVLVLPLEQKKWKVKVEKKGVWFEGLGIGLILELLMRATQGMKLTYLLEIGLPL